jgi:hypothetical protein
MSEIIGLSVQLQADKAIESVGSIKKAMREAQKEVQVLSDKFGATSKEAINAAKVAGELKDRIGDAKALTEAFNPDAKFKALTSSLAGVAGGFSALQGSMALFGAETEDVQKTLLKVQGAMAASQGLQAIGESIDSFKQLGAVIKTQVVTAFTTLRGAIIATGVGALAVGLGLIVANFEAVKKAVLSAIPGLETFGKWIGKTIDSITDFVGVTSEASRALDKLKKDADATLKVNEKFMKEHGDQVDKYTKQKIDAKNKYLEAIKEDGANVAALGKRLNRELAAADKERADDAQKARDEEAKKRAEEAKKAKEARDKVAKDIEEENERRKNAELKFFFDRLKAIDSLNAQRAKEKAEQDALDKEMLDQSAKDAETLADREYNIVQTSIKNDKLAKDAKAKIAKEEADAKIAALDATASAITSLSMIAGKETVAGKALAIAASIINTYKGITQALGSAPPPFNFISAAAVGAAGFAAVKNIVSVQVPGGGGGGSVPSAPNLNAGSPLQPTTIAANQVTLDQRSINAMGNRAIKAYVVETEISSAQQKIRRIQKQTTFG